MGCEAMPWRPSSGLRVQINPSCTRVRSYTWHLSGTVFLNRQQRSRRLPVQQRHFLCPGHDQPPCLSACQHRPTDCKLIQYNNGPTPQVLSDLKTMLGVTSLGFEDNFQAEYYW
jgi:hypothetical protein